MLKKKKGFTLIELLVVIAIIGILSTLAIIALGNARAKARDAKRLSDVKQISTALEIAETTTAAQVIGGCVTAGVGISTGTTPCTALNEANNGVNLTWTNFKDPSTSASTVACTVASTTGVCDYSTHVTAMTTSNYDICFRTEQSSNLGPAGLYRITSGGNITGGCP